MQKRQKSGFFVSVSFDSEISRHKRKSRKQKVKRYDVCAKSAEKTQKSLKVFCLELV